MGAPTAFLLFKPWCARLRRAASWFGREFTFFKAIVVHLSLTMLWRIDTYTRHRGGHDAKHQLKQIDHLGDCKHTKGNRM